MKSIILLMPYYGKLPCYFDIWLSAAKSNKSIDFCLITDLVKKDTELPENIKLLNISFEEFKNRIQKKFSFKISIDNLGRISQFRPALGYCFPELIKGYDFWGFIECDLIPGNIRHFITEEILETHDKIFKLGHFQIFKNNERMKKLFMQEHKSALSYKFAFSRNILFFEELLGMHNISQAEGIKTYTENVFSDVKASELFFIRSKYAYPDIHNDKHCLYEYINGALYEYSFNGKNINRQEVLYVHLQKREMNVCTVDFNKYLIIPNQFINYQQINESFFEKVEESLVPIEKDYKSKKEDGFNLARKKRYKQLCWWKLAAIRSRIRKNGGVDLDGK